MFEKFKNSFFNIFLFCVAFGILFFVKVSSFAAPSFTYSAVNGNPGYENTFSVAFRDSGDMLVAFYIDNPNNYPRYNVSVYTNLSNPLTFDKVSYPNAPSGVDTLSVSSYGDIYIQTITGWSALFNSVWSFNTNPSIPVFDDFNSLQTYLLTGTLPSLPFDDSLKLDKFKVISKGDWVQEVLNGFVRFDHIVCQPFWSDERIDSVELSVYAVDSNFNYQPRNFTFESDQSGQYHDFDISGLTLHGQKFIVQATPYSRTGKGVSIAYEFTFPSEFTQPIGDLVIKEPNQYPYSTTLDISGNDVPVEWTVTQTPIYIYETNNYYGDPVSYPVPEITETTNENYYQEYIDNYYNDYTTVINNYNNTFDFDFGDVTGNDIQQGYDDVGGFLNGIGNLISKLSSLFSGLFPFLSPLVAVSLLTVFGLVVVIGGIVLFIKIIKALLP